MRRTRRGARGRGCARWSPRCGGGRGGTFALAVPCKRARMRSGRCVRCRAPRADRGAARRRAAGRREAAGFCSVGCGARRESCSMGHDMSRLTRGERREEGGPREHARAVHSEEVQPGCVVRGARVLACVEGATSKCVRSPGGVGGVCQADHGVGTGVVCVMRSCVLLRCRLTRIFRACELQMWIP